MEYSGQNVECIVQKSEELRFGMNERCGRRHSATLGRRDRHRWVWSRQSCGEYTVSQFPQQRPPSMSSSPTTADASRSSSPMTPEPPDTVEPIAINNSEPDFSPSWFLSTSKPLSSPHTWEIVPSFITSGKPDEDQMLGLDELLEQHAYAESVFL